jgi:hypothetical protein
MNNITVGESPLKVVVGEKVATQNFSCGMTYDVSEEVKLKGEGYNEAIDKTLSTPLPPVEDCVGKDRDKIRGIVLDGLNNFIYGICSDGQHREILLSCVESITEKLANGKSILSWRKA